MKDISFWGRRNPETCHQPHGVSGGVLFCHVEALGGRAWEGVHPAPGQPLLLGGQKLMLAVRVRGVS